ncbi:hypothetical protein WJX79_008636 [Trebouxia sp. C0005]
MVKIPHGTIVDMILADPVIAKQFECYLSSHSLRHQKKLEESAGDQVLAVVSAQELLTKFSMTNTWPDNTVENYFQYKPSLALSLVALVLFFTVATVIAIQTYKYRPRCRFMWIVVFTGGETVVLIGLAIQLFFFSSFTLVAGYVYRLQQTQASNKVPGQVYVCLFVTIALITMRNVYPSHRASGGVVRQVQHQRKVLLLPGCTPNLLSILRV